MNELKVNYVNFMKVKHSVLSVWTRGKKQKQCCISIGKKCLQQRRGNHPKLYTIPFAYMVAMFLLY